MADSWQRCRGLCAGGSGGNSRPVFLHRVLHLDFANMRQIDNDDDDDIQDYKKPWVKLRNEEISKILQAHEQNYEWFAFARAIEKLSKDKNL
jgi:hypothetical protein